MYTFIQEIQEALEERQNNLDNSSALTQTNTSSAEPFAFESQINTDTYPVDLPSKLTDNLLQSPNESNKVTNETIPLLGVVNEKKKEDKQSEIHLGGEQKFNWISTKDTINIKKEAVTPVK